MLANDPMENADSADPTEPIDNTDPIEPIDNTDPRDPMLKNESVERIDNREPLAIEPFWNIATALSRASVQQFVEIETHRGLQRKIARLDDASNYRSQDGRQRLDIVD